MTLVELYSKEDCHLCEVAKDTLFKVQKSFPFQLRVIGIRDGDEYFEEFKERVPVVFINKELAFQYKVPEKELINSLNRVSQSE